MEDDKEWAYSERISKGDIEFPLGVYGAGYKGYQHKTRFGLQCMSWSETFQKGWHKHEELQYEIDVCRNPDKSRYIWCYAKTAKGGITKERCDPIGAETNFAEDYYFGPHLGLQYKYK